jgi:hypothetical protein
MLGAKKSERKRNEKVYSSPLLPRAEVLYLYVLCIRTREKSENDSHRQRAFVFIFPFMMELVFVTSSEWTKLP